MPIHQKLGDMTIPTKTYCGLPFFDLPIYIEFSELLEKNKIDSILYPKPEGFTALGWSVYLHPLHPDHNASQRLADESRVNRISGLLRIPVNPTPPFDYNSEKQQQSKRIAGHIKSIQTNKFYKIISNTLGFKNAYALFRQKQKLTKDNLYKKIDAEFYFISSIGYCIAIYEFSRGKELAKFNATKTSIRSAISHTQKLNKLFYSGVALESPQDHRQLSKLMADLLNQLSQREKSGRKKWSGEKSKYRQFIQQYADQLQLHFGESSPKLIFEVASIIGCDVDIKTIENYVKANKSERLYGALKTYRKNSSIKS